MPGKCDLEFVDASSPLGEPVTKFGGVPVWIGPPSWPVSRRFQRPMRFLAQIAIPAELFPGVQARMAYLFITDDPRHPQVGTHDPFGGENAVILQPGPNGHATLPLTDGPILQRWCRVRQEPCYFLHLFFPPEARRVLRPCEFAVRFVPGEDPDHPALQGRVLGEIEKRAWALKLGGCKIGGSPGLVDPPVWAAESNWRLLVQLDSRQTPFVLPFGRQGIGSVFLDTQGREARFLWQEP